MPSIQDLRDFVYFFINDAPCIVPIILIGLGFILFLLALLGGINGWWERSLPRQIVVGIFGVLLVIFGLLYYNGPCEPKTIEINQARRYLDNTIIVKGTCSGCVENDKVKLVFSSSGKKIDPSQEIDPTNGSWGWTANKEDLKNKLKNATQVRAILMKNGIESPNSPYTDAGITEFGLRLLIISVISGIGLIIFIFIFIRKFKRSSFARADT